MNTNIKPLKVYPIFRIQGPKLAIKCVGYINLQTRNRAEIEGKRKLKVRIFKTKKALQFRQVFLSIYNKAKKIKHSAQAFLQSCFLESTLDRAKQALQDARRGYSDTISLFPLFVDFCRAVKTLREFKYSLPKQIRFQLF